MGGPVDLLVLLYLLVDLLVGLLAPFILLGVRLGGAPAEAAHDDGRRPDAAARRMLRLLAIRRRTRRIGDAARLVRELGRGLAASPTPRLSLYQQQNSLGSVLLSGASPLHWGTWPLVPLPVPRCCLRETEQAEEWSWVLLQGGITLLTELRALGRSLGQGRAARLTLAAKVPGCGGDLADRLSHSEFPVVVTLVARCSSSRERSSLTCRGVSTDDWSWVTALGWRSAASWLQQCTVQRVIQCACVRESTLRVWRGEETTNKKTMRIGGSARPTTAMQPSLTLTRSLTYTQIQHTLPTLGGSALNFLSAERENESIWRLLIVSSARLHTHTHTYKQL